MRQFKITSTSSSISSRVFFLPVSVTKLILRQKLAVAISFSTSELMNVFVSGEQ